MQEENKRVTVYNKFSLERYPITLKHQHLIYALVLEADHHMRFQKLQSILINVPQVLDYVYLCQHLDY
jgi:hypothetical protein